MFIVGQGCTDVNPVNENVGRWAKVAITVFIDFLNIIIGCYNGEVCCHNCCEAKGVLSGQEEE